MTQPTYPVVTSNMQVRSLYESYQQMLEEINNSLSKSTIGTLEADAGRWLSYVSSARSYSEYFQSIAMLDLPVTKGRLYELKNPIYPDLKFKENVAVQDLIDIVVGARDELVVSASAGIPMHLFPADLERQQSYWDAMQGLIEKYLLVVQPLDQPVTSAMENLGLDPGATPPA